jgi:hypothetical protein
MYTRWFSLPSKARLFKGARMSEGGATRRAMECLCFRLLRDNDTQPDRSLLSSIEEIKALNLADPQNHLLARLVGRIPPGDCQTQ